LTVTVADQQIVKVRGSQVNPITRGAICGKVSRYPEWIHGPDRLRTPLQRTGPKGEGQFARLTWEAALDLIYTRFTAIQQQYGPEAIVPLNYAGPHGFLAAGSMDLRFFHKLGASRLARRPLCGGVKSEAFMGTYGAVPLMRPEHVAAAQLIIVWGSNTTVSQMHLVPFIRAARKRGARLVVLDPRRVPIARQADLHLALRPGTDVVLAWAVAAELERLGSLDPAFIAQHVLGVEAFLEEARRWTPDAAAEVCGVEATQIRQLSTLYRDTSPAVICPGTGLERNQNGGRSIYRAL